MRGAKGLIVVLGLMMPLAAQRVDAAEARRVLEQHGCQVSLPGEAGGGVGGDKRAERRDGWNGPSLGGGRAGVGLATLAMWTGVGLAIAAVVVAALRSRGGRVPAAAAAPRPVVVTEQDGALIAAAPAGDECDQLAERGLFAEAVHGLLLRAFVALAARVGGLPPHATGRELLRLGRSRALAVEPLQRLVLASERVHFGGRAADRALYDDLRQQLTRWEAVCRDAK
ncbi:MAG: DUF4129 domain-containing protein [Planctomycetota bacterium]